jgi:hypothetical protein
MADSDQNLTVSKQENAVHFKYTTYETNYIVTDNRADDNISLQEAFKRYREAKQVCNFVDFTLHVWLLSVLFLSKGDNFNLAFLNGTLHRYCMYIHEKIMIPVQSMYHL